MIYPSGEVHVAFAPLLIDLILQCQFSVFLLEAGLQEGRSFICLIVILPVFSIALGTLYFGGL